MRLIATIWYFFISFLEFVFVIFKPKLWRYYFYFQLEYFFFSPYHYADKNAADDFVFGFTPMFSLDKIIKKSMKFYYEKTDYPLAFCDAGCGDGRSIFLVNTLYNRPVCGIEVNVKFIKKIMFIKSLLIKKQKNIRNIMVVSDDMFNSEFYGYGIIFITWTTFKETTENRLIKKLEKEVHKDGIVVTLTYPVKSDYFEQLGQLKVLTSWGRSVVFFQRKVK